MNDHAKYNAHHGKETRQITSSVQPALLQKAGIRASKDYLCKKSAAKRNDSFCGSLSI
jgi:hypothetical protein